MSRWQQKFDSHAIHETLRQLSEWADTEFEKLDSELEIERKRLRKILALINQSIAGMDPDLFPEQELTNINNHLRNANSWSHMSSFAQSGSTGYLISTNDHINSILPKILAISALSAKPTAVEKVKAAERAFEKFAKKADQSIGEFNTKLENAEKTIETLSTKTADLEEKQETFIAESKKLSTRLKNKWRQILRRKRTRSLKNIILIFQRDLVILLNCLMKKPMM